jgi:hypothetical protein
MTTGASLSLRLEAAPSGRSPRAGLRAKSRRLYSAAGLVLLAWLALLATPSCNDDSGLLRAKQIEARNELVGGPVAMADIGDYLLENDQVRVAILGAKDSPGPGVFGGALVDIDLRRPNRGLGEAQGRDRFAESFPLANLLVPEPEKVDIRVLHDGSDGEKAVIRVEGQGQFLFEALGVLRSKKALLEVLFPDVRTDIRFRTDYELRPGWRYIKARTTLSFGDETKQGCPDVSGCALSCEHGLAQSPNGCVVCECSDLMELPMFTEPVSLFGSILGDVPDEEGALNRAGLSVGDFVFFGNQNNVFAPGPGFDENAAVQDANNSGRNTFQVPLTFDFVAASGGDISYGYFTVRDPDSEPAVVNVPLFASAATAFLVAGVNCQLDASDDATCDKNRSFVYERYLAVGHGDVASVVDVMHEVRGEPTGTLSGHVLWAETGEPAANARLFVLADPDPSRTFETAYEALEANYEAFGDAGVVDAIDADVGLDPEEDGDFSATLTPGSYLVVARDEGLVVSSAPVRVKVRAGEEVEIGPALPTPATVEVRVSDEAGVRMPAKVQLIALDAKGAPLETDGRRLVPLGEGRLGNGLRSVSFLESGEGTIAVEPGRYAVLVARGVEYGIHLERDVTLSAGQRLLVDALVAREVDSEGWMSVDMHLHSTPSFDSGMPVPRRVRTAVTEGIELAVSTDHDVHSDYLPSIVDMQLEPFVKTAIGAEITTLEQGHFIGFPLTYDELEVPSHGAHDWTCQSGGEILDGIREKGDGIEPLTIVAHPRDGFFGYVDQLGVDAFSLNRKPTLLEEDNSVFRVASCDYDAMEIISAKRHDLDRTATVGEIVDYNRCLARINAAKDADELASACPELSDGLLAPCKQGDRYKTCQTRNRTKLASLMSRRIHERTPDEQDMNWAFPGSSEDSKDICSLDLFGDSPVPAGLRDLPCTHKVGHVDDFFRYLERGMLKTQVGSSDSHNDGKEPGYPRTYFRSETDDPLSLDVTQAVESLRGGHAFATYGPFVRATLDEASFGDVARASPGDQKELFLDVETASWFGIDRVEVYLNGRMLRVIDPKSEPRDVVDVHGKVTFTVPDRDSWLVVIAMGIDDENLLGPVSVDVPYGEVQLARVASDAFGRIPVVNTLFSAPLVVPDWGPMFPYAVTNPIYIDTDGNGRYDAPLPPPDFCSKRCDPASGDADQCPAPQVCLDEEAVCGFVIRNRCVRRPALSRDR